MNKYTREQTARLKRVRAALERKRQAEKIARLAVMYGMGLRRLNEVLRFH